MHICPNVNRFMRPADVAAFRKEAATQKSYILVRKPNPEARKYIGMAGFKPKPFDCKFKTADKDFYHQGLNNKLTVGGLVVNPTLDEFEKAFSGKKSYQTAVNLWHENAEDVSEVKTHDAEGNKAVQFLPEGKQFMVNSDTSSSYYGCIMHSRISHSTHINYFHSDYDLYAVIPTSNPKSVKSFLSELYDKPHYREVNFFDYQHRLNRAMGVPMIQHAPQELTGQHINDQVLVFMPDLPTVFMLANQLEIRDFYQNILGGRQLSNTSTKFI